MSVERRRLKMSKFFKQRFGGTNTATAATIGSHEMGSSHNMSPVAAVGAYHVPPPPPPQSAGHHTNGVSGYTGTEDESKRGMVHSNYQQPPQSNYANEPDVNSDRNSMRSRPRSTTPSEKNKDSRNNFNKIDLAPRRGVERESSQRSSARERSNPSSNAQYSPRYPSPATSDHQSSSHIQGMSPVPQDGTPSSAFPSSTTIQSQDQKTHRRPAYLLHRDLVIGKGSYGQVCIASRGDAEGHSRPGGKRKKFACKCVVLRNDPKYIAKLQEEVNVLRELRGHENVIRLYDVFCVDNELFIITELGRGGDLFHLLTTHPKHGVTEAYAAKTVAQMLSAVAFLHSRYICHRDLKLENWVLESGKDVWSPIKLIDFGLSTHYTPGHRLSRVVGSSYYVAPEVLKKSYTEACDLWSLGVIVYMLLSGAPPFYGRNDEAIKASIVNGEYTFPHELFRDVSDEAMAFVSTLLSYNVEYRYTAEQALTHPWLQANCDPDQLLRTKNWARGIGVSMRQYEETPQPMQL